MRLGRWGAVLGALAALTALGGCSRGEDAERTQTEDPAPSAVTHVQMAVVRLDTLRTTVTAPGRTEALREETVRAPFAGSLVRIRVADGDRVEAGAELGTLVSRSSEAALAGAEAMLATAQTAQDSADARTALDLATKDRVERTLRAVDAGVVLSHAVSPGDRLGEGDEILRIAAQGSVVFLANVSQSDLGRVRAGQAAQVILSARTDTLAGTVHGVMPAADTQSFSAPVRIDFRNAPEVPSVGLFGTATLVVGEHRGVRSVPERAVLTDDVTGVSEVAAVRNARVRWVPVEIGVRDQGWGEVLSPGLAVGDTVIVAGQVGLPDSTVVQAGP